MNIDMAALRSLEREKDVSFDLLVEAIESALLVAYQRTEGANPHARASVDRSTGEVTVIATEMDADGNPVREFEDTPHDFNRIAASTAKQIILQRLRDAEHELTFGEYAGREGDIVGGVIQQQHDSRNVFVDLGKVEAVLPAGEQVPGERYEHGSRIRCYVVQVHKGVRGPQITLSRTHPGLVRKLFALELAVMAELHGEKIDIVDWSDDPAEFVGHALSPARVSAVEVVDLANRSARVTVPDYQLSLAIGREGQNARLAARLTGWPDQRPQ